MRDNLRKVIGVLLLLLLVLGALAAFFQWHGAGGIQQEVVDTRRVLREQGFKTDLADFNFTTDNATRTREAELTAFGDLVEPSTPADTIDLLPTVADGSAVVIWKEDWLSGENGTVAWSDLHESLGEILPELDLACNAALSGPIRFDLDASRGRAMLLRHLAPLRKLGKTLGARTIVELHEGHADAAGTNLLALTRLATAWKVEPAAVSQMVRFGLVDIGFDAAWQALQSHELPDEKLAALQREWASADFFASLPETAAFQRASDTALCQLQRRQPMAGGMPLSEMIKESVHSPGVAISALKQSWNAARYRSYGTFDDERNLLLFYQKRELELRAAVTAPTWAQMQALPGVTNEPMFTSPYRSQIVPMLHIQATGLWMLNHGSSLLACAATAESRRRIIVTAIALERFRQRHNAYPQALAELVPDFLKAAPVDFMDGQPLRYRPADSGQFTLYSAGLNCVDEGGTPPMSRLRPMRGPAWGMAAAGPEGDLVWPRPASAGDVATQHQQELDAARSRADEIEDLQARAQWEHTARHQANLEIILAAPAITNLADIPFHGRPLTETLRNPPAAGTNRLSLVELLALRQIITGGEPETVTFELPIAYDVITNLGELHLYVDPTNSDDSDMGCNAMQVECTRAANGDCRLAWSTIYESPGRHALQAGLTVSELPPDQQNFDGPLLPCAITNPCQFSAGSSIYDVALGARFHARLPENNARYAIECVTTNGVHLATLTGSTTNGEFNAVWDLVDERGSRLKGETFNSIVHLTFPDSGRTVTLRGP